MIKTEDLRYAYGSHQVLKGINMEAREGELLCILGANGAGKSTLFKCILGLLKGYQGSITIAGRNMLDLSASEKASLVAYIPQAAKPTFAYSVLDMVMMGTTSHLKGFSSPGKKERDLAEAALDKMGIAQLINRDYMKLSGGEQQMVLISRALAQGARTLIMDEPTSNLDYGNQMKVQQQLKNLALEGYSIIQSTHNPEQTYYFADRIISILDGQVYKQGKPAEIMDSHLIHRLYGIDAKTIATEDDRVRYFEPVNLGNTLKGKNE